jgi:hypothetical protein
MIQDPTAFFVLRLKYTQAAIDYTLFSHLGNPYEP